MDDQQGNVIDGTERARQWRRSRSSTGPAADSAETRSDAPKSFAGSLLVPAEMLPPAPVPEEGANGNGNGPGVTAEPRPDRTADGRAPTHDSVHQNPFLVPEAARLDRPARSSRGRAVAAEFARRLRGGAVLLLPRRPGRLRLGSRRRSRALRLTHPLAMGAVVAAIVTTTVLATQARNGQRSTHHRSGTSATATSKGSSTAAVMSDAYALRAIARQRAAEITSSRHPRRSVPAHRRARPQVKHADTSTQYVPATSNSGTVAPVSASPTYSSSGSAAGSSEPASPTAGGSTGGSSSGGSSRPAFGQNGTLGPGHSPNS